MRRDFVGSERADSPPTRGLSADAVSPALLAGARIGRVGVVVVADRRRLLEEGVEVLVRHWISRRRREDGHGSRRHARLVPLGKIILMHRRDWNQERAQFGL